eukprot:3941507-Rhodomonas_salina.5
MADLGEGEIGEQMANIKEEWRQTVDGMKADATQVEERADGTCQKPSRSTGGKAETLADIGRKTSQTKSQR